MCLKTLPCVSSVGVSWAGGRKGRESLHACFYLFDSARVGVWQQNRAALKFYTFYAETEDMYLKELISILCNFHSDDGRRTLQAACWIPRDMFFFHFLTFLPSQVTLHHGLNGWYSLGAICETISILLMVSPQWKKAVAVCSHCAVWIIREECCFRS